MLTTLLDLVWFIDAFSFSLTLLSLLGLGPLTPSLLVFFELGFFRSTGLSPLHLIVSTLISLRIMRGSLPLLLSSMGLVLGSLWSLIVYNQSWSWDPIELLSLGFILASTLFDHLTSPHSLSLLTLPALQLSRQGFLQSHHSLPHSPNTLCSDLSTEVAFPYQTLFTPGPATVIVANSLNLYDQSCFIINPEINLFDHYWVFWIILNLSGPVWGITLSPYGRKRLFRQCLVKSHELNLFRR